MGRKIDAIIQSLTAMKSVIGVNQLTINEAVDTMRKYQKIEQIVEHWAGCGNPSDAMIAISEVLENGKEN